MLCTLLEPGGFGDATPFTVIWFACTTSTSFPIFTADTPCLERVPSYRGAPEILIWEERSKSTGRVGHPPTALELSSLTTRGRSELCSLLLCRAFLQSLERRVQLLKDGFLLLNLDRIPQGWYSIHLP